MASAVHSTPLSKGSAGRMPSQENTESSLRSYLMEDISKELELSIEELMKLIFDRDDWTELIESQTVKDMAEDSQFKAHMTTYGDAKAEEDLYQPFVDLANYVLGSEDSSGKPRGIILCRNDPTKVRGSERGISPDVVGAFTEAITKTIRISPKNCAKQGPEMLPFHWSEILWSIEIKLTDAAKREMLIFKVMSQNALNGEGGSHAVRQTRAGEQLLSQKRRRDALPDGGPENKRSKTGKPRTNAKIQCASYALETLSNGGLRTHALGFHIDGYNLQVQYFDRSTFVSSTPFSLRKEPCKFIALLYVLRALDKEQWGFVPGVDCHFTGPTIWEMKTGLRSKDLLKGKTLKLSDGSTLEFEDILSRHHGHIGRGTIVVQGRISTNPDPNQVFAVKISSPAITRKNEKDLLQLAYTEATGGFKNMQDHLPKLRHWEDIDLGPRSSRTKLAGFYDVNKYERRALRLITFLELWPIQILSPKSLPSPLRDIFKCYRWLYEKVGILHRDISLPNLMYYLKDDKACGVLNDFDLATCVSDSSPSSIQRTGAVPYMAYELLATPGIRHLYRHDLESLFYVIVIITSHFKDGKEIKEPPLEKWFTKQVVETPSIKFTILHRANTWKDYVLEPYKPFVGWLNPMRAMFNVVVNLDPTLDEETAGGTITFDKMAQIFAIDLNWKTSEDPFLSPT